MVLYSMLLGSLLLGTGVGWRPLPGGEGMEYLIQLSPEDVEALKLGEAWMSDIPASVGEVRAYRITVGTGTLPRDAPLPRRPPSEEDGSAGEPALHRIQPGLDVNPLPERRAVHITPESGKADPPPGGEAALIAGTAAEKEEPPSRPWMLLVGTALALAGSLGGNAYLLWGLREAQRRYRELAAGRSPADGV